MTISYFLEMSHESAANAELPGETGASEDPSTGIDFLAEWFRVHGQTQKTFAATVTRASGKRLTQAGVSRWFTRGVVPPTRVRAVSVVTGIPKFQLRPDIFDETDDDGSQ